MLFYICTLTDIPYMSATTTSLLNIAFKACCAATNWPKNSRLKNINDKAILHVFLKILYVQGLVQEMFSKFAKLLIIIKFRIK